MLPLIFFPVENVRGEVHVDERWAMSYVARSSGSMLMLVEFILVGFPLLLASFLSVPCRSALGRMQMQAQLQIDRQGVVDVYG